MALSLLFFGASDDLVDASSAEGIILLDLPQASDTVGTEGCEFHFTRVVKRIAWEAISVATVGPVDDDDLERLSAVMATLKKRWSQLSC